MNLKKFRERLFILKPNLKDLILEGYSEERAHRIINNEYEFKPKANQNQYSSILLDFLNNYDLRNLRILNIFFDDILRYINEYLIIGGFDGGHLGLDNKTGIIYILYSDDSSNIHEIFVKNEIQFFEILLIFAEFSNKGSEDEIEDYLQRCYKICPEGNFDSFFWK